MNNQVLKQWDQICANTARQMVEHIKPFTTPISRALSDSEGEHLGSGSYFEFKGKKYIITNEHVATHISKTSITHHFYDSEHIIKLTNPAYAIPPPVDVAVSQIEENIWGICKHGAMPIPFSRFAKKYTPIQHELLFFVGYSGERSKFLFGHLFTPGTPYLTQECPFPNEVDEADPNFHFALHYKPDLAKSIDDSSHLPDPHGFSGSLIWDTKRVECLNTGTEWSPKLAEVTGIVWGWPSSSACILATKVEFLCLNKIPNIEVDNA